VLKKKRQPFSCPKTTANLAASVSPEIGGFSHARFYSIVLVVDRKHKKRDARERRAWTGCFSRCGLHGSRAIHYTRVMDVDQILATMNDCQVEYLLIGGMNFLLRHEPVLTFDVDLWINDREANRRRCERALEMLEAEWGETDSDWGKVAERGPGWLDRQPVFCLNSPSGAIDIFRSVTGLADWAASRVRASRNMTAGGAAYWGLSDEDMLYCGSGTVTAMRDWIAWESAKRLRNWDRAERWRVLQQTISWAERQATVRRNTPAACLREQQRKLSQMRTHQANQA
jgi:hypothetical protein